MQTALKKLENDSSAFMSSSVLAALAELDVATALLQCENSATAAGVAKKCSCDNRGMEVLLDALSALGYLTKSDGEPPLYSVAAPFLQLLDSRNQASYIPMLRHRALLMRSWSKLSFAVKFGEPQKEESFLGEAEDSVSFIQAMNAIAIHCVQDTVENLRPLLESLPDEATILDIGGASGTYTEAFLHCLPNSRATLFDLPIGISQAKKRFHNSALKARVTLLEGDFTKTGFPHGFDFAWISAIIHQMDRMESRSLYEKTFQALTRGGVVAIRDFVMDESRTNPEAGALFGVNMLLKTKHGRVYTFREIEEDLRMVGFTDVRHFLPSQTMSAVVTAIKGDIKG
ncbi:MAG: methyltransferase domain-containing protein [Desulfovibrionaceae bacterium]|nr:methyltransferase domain-containing protein [Desulfovibrionaceae bacterium]